MRLYADNAREQRKTEAKKMFENKKETKPSVESNY